MTMANTNHDACLKCKTHCCGNEYIGMEDRLVPLNRRTTHDIILDNKDVTRLTKAGKKSHILVKNQVSYLKLDNKRCSLLVNNECSVYEARPDACRVYPFYFDTFGGIAKDSNCKRTFELSQMDFEGIYKLLEKRLKFFKSLDHELSLPG